MAEKPPFDPNAAYQAGEKPEFDPSKSFKVGDPNQIGTVEDVARSALGGLRKGAENLVGVPGDIQNAALKGANYLAGTNAQPPSFGFPTSSDIAAQTKKEFGEPYTPQSEMGRGAETVSSFIPGAAIAGSTGGVSALPSAIMRYGILPGAATVAAEHALPESAYKPYLTAAAGLAPALVNPARIVTPLPISEARHAMIETLKKEGVTSLTAGQKTGNEALKYLESASKAVPFGGGKIAGMERESQHQLTEAVMRRAGTGPDASPEVLAANQKRLGQSFEDLSNRNTLVPDNRFITDLVENVKDYRKVPESQQKQIVQGYVDDIVGHINNGHMPGTFYQEMRSRLTTQSKSLAQSDPTLSNALRGMRNSLDDAMDRSMHPDDVKLWRETRSQYGAQKQIEKMASRAGEAATEGQITAPNLRNTVSAENRGAYARGEGQLPELARAAAGIMTPLPNSGTAQRLNALNILNETLLKVPSMAGARLVSSKPMQAYLANQLLAPQAMAPNSAAQKALMIKLLQNGQQ